MWIETQDRRYLVNLALVDAIGTKRARNSQAGWTIFACVNGTQETVTLFEGDTEAEADNALMCIKAAIANDAVRVFEAASIGE